MDFLQQIPLFIDKGREAVHEARGVFNEAVNAFHEIKKEVSPIINDIENAYYDVRYGDERGSSNLGDFMERVGKNPTKGGGNDQQLVGLIDSVGGEQRAFYEDLRTRIMLYNELKNNEFLLYSNLNNYDKYLKPLSKTILGLHDIPSVTRDEFAARWDALDKATLKNVLLHKLIKFELDVIAWELDFEKNIDYDTVKLCREYHVLKHNAIKEKYDFVDII